MLSYLFCPLQDMRNCCKDGFDLGQSCGLGNSRKFKYTHLKAGKIEKRQSRSWILAEK